jgi:hypothetical protein
MSKKKEIRKLEEKFKRKEITLSEYVRGLSKLLTKMQMIDRLVTLLTGYVEESTKKGTSRSDS